MALLLAVAVAPSRLCAQTVGWVIRQAPGIDLWFHAVAIAGLEGFGRFPLYRARYAVSVRRDRDARGVPPTRLELGALRFLDAFQRDSAFEVVHFLPLYFAAADHAERLAVLSRMPDPGDGPGIPRSAQFGATAAARALQAPRERRELAAFAAAVDEEWTSASDAEWRRLVTCSDAIVTEAQVRWRERCEPALRPSLNRYRLAGGVMLLSPSVGLEGRLAQGRSPRLADNVSVVGLSPERAAENVLFEAVRELCFPAVRLAIPPGPDDERIADEYLSSNAAVRCGDLILARYAPDVRAGYQRFRLSATGAPAVASLGGAFPVPASRLAALARAIEPTP